MTNKNSVLMIFVKNPSLGKVKTRLAATMGDEQAFRIYKGLLGYTKSVTQDLDYQKQIYYSDFIDDLDLWSGQNYEKKLQKKGDLGQKMLAGFEDNLGTNYQKGVLIGSDCAQMSKEIISDAFNKLTDYDVVLGPANDGGYYLVGLKKPVPELFLDKEWSTERVLQEAVDTCKQLNLSFYLLPELVDIDYESEYLQFKEVLDQFREERE